MPATATFEVLEIARALAAEFVRCARLPGWGEQERAVFEQASAAVWAARGLMLVDHDEPHRRRRAAVLEDARIAARSVDLDLHTDRAERDTLETMSLKAAAEALGMRRSALAGRAKRRGVGFVAADGSLAFTFEDIKALTQSLRGR